MLERARGFYTLILCALVAATLVPARADDAKPNDSAGKPASTGDARRNAIEQIVGEIRHRLDPEELERVIYGADDRLDYYQVSDPFLVGLADAACVVLEPSDLTNNGDGTYTLNATRWFSQGGVTLCNDEPFRGQYQVGFCSGFLVGQQIVVTAGHCVSTSDCGSSPVAFVFDFNQLGPTTDPQLIVPADKVYFCNGVIDRVQAGELDHSVVQLDRPVVGRNPVPIRRTDSIANGEPLVMIGHPVVLPKKIDDGGVVKNNRPGGGYFTANVDAYGGNSGSAVFNLNTGVVEGILVRGNTDFTTVGGCRRSNVCPDTGCSGTFEEISKTFSFQQFIPELGLAVAPGAGTLHVGPVGGPFSDPVVVYTLSNPTGDPLDYSVALQADGDPVVLINGGTTPVGGTIPGGGAAQVTVSLDPSVAGLPAGVFADTVVFTDTTNTISTSRTHTVEVGATGFTVSPANGLTAGGPVGGPFTATQLYTITSTKPTPVSVLIAASEAWISLDGGAGPLSVMLDGVGDSANVVVGFSAAANALGNGLYNGGVSFTNTSGGAGDTSRPVSLDVGRYSYASVDVPKTILDNTTVTSVINIGDAYCIGDVDVCLDITHTYIGDLRVDLTSPSGVVVRLHNRTGGSADNIVKCYDGVLVNPDGPGALADFNGGIVTGVWTLTIADLANADQGQLNAWSLKIAASGAVCPPVASDLALELPDTATSNITLQAASSVPQNLAYTIMSLPSHGTLIDPLGGPIVTAPYTLLAQGAVVRYKPTPLFVGSDSFLYAANDGQPSNIATVNVVLGEEAVVYGYPLDANPGWAVQGQWAFGQPTGQGANGRLDPTSGYSGVNVYGYNLNGHYANSMAQTDYLTTSALDFSDVSGVKLRFRRWLGIESAQFDKANIQASGDGVNWIDVWSHSGSSLNEQTWTLHTFDLSAIVDGQPAAHVRWGLGPTDTSVTYHGWNIDDIEFLGLLPRGVKADLNCDGVVNFGDIDAFVAALAGADAYAQQHPGCIWINADVNCDGMVNFGDIDAFVACLSGPCDCP